MTRSPPSTIAVRSAKRSAADSVMAAMLGHTGPSLLFMPQLRSVARRPRRPGADTVIDIDVSIDFYLEV
ncbi:hypothetical protein GCM10009546_37650 [Actinomadura livida]|uniref:Uncharacterized protein n=1 Tax=Actinomadura livida TaxID=79909 RepID=A0ABP3PNI1_9ACTN